MAGGGECPGRFGNRGGHLALVAARGVVAHEQRMPLDGGACGQGFVGGSGGAVAVVGRHQGVRDAARGDIGVRAFALAVDAVEHVFAGWCAAGGGAQAARCPAGFAERDEAVVVPGGGDGGQGVGDWAGVAGSAAQFGDERGQCDAVVLAGRAGGHRGVGVHGVGAPGSAGGHQQAGFVAGGHGARRMGDRRGGLAVAALDGDEQGTPVTVDPGVDAVHRLG